MEELHERGQHRELQWERTIKGRSVQRRSIKRRGQRGRCTK